MLIRKDPFDVWLSRKGHFGDTPLSVPRCAVTPYDRTCLEKNGKMPGVFSSKSNASGGTQVEFVQKTHEYIEPAAAVEPTIRETLSLSCISYY